MIKAVNDFVKLYSGKGNYAVFDFDNTCSVFDVEEQLAIYQLQVMAFEIKPGEMRDVVLAGLKDLDKDLSEYGFCKGSYNDLADDISGAYKYLWDSYGPFSAVGLPEEKAKTIQKDKYWLEFATKFRAMLDLIFEKDTCYTSLPWILYWFKGMTEEQVYDLAIRSHKHFMTVDTTLETWESPKDLKSKAGPMSYTWTNGIQVPKEVIEVWKTLSNSGFDLWICSASSTAAIRAAIDVFGLHDYCRGMIGMRIKTDSEGKFITEYDYDEGYGYYTNKDGSWTKMTRPQKAMTQGEGKVVGIMNAIAPDYDGKGPIACFMDANGDFNFCTEFSSVKMVVCFNRANRSVKDGSGLIAEVSVYENETLGYDLKKANENGDTYYVLQGRDENGKRTLRNDNKTVRVGQTEAKLFQGQQNYDQIQYMKDNNMTVKEIFDTFALKTPAEKSALGFEYGMFDEYSGYHSK